MTSCPSPEPKQPRKTHRRRKPPVTTVLPRSWWQRAVGVVIFLCGGAAAAAWGSYELAGWIASLGRGDAVIETDNFILGLPLLGGSMFLLGPEFILPRALARWSDTTRTRAAAAILGTMLVGVVLIFVGQIVINIAMELDGYRACYVGGRGRVTDVIWAREHADCPARARAGA